MAKSASKQGSKPPVLLLHGFRGTSEGLAEVAEGLRERGFKVYAPDVPPFGKAGALKEYTPESYAEYVKEFIVKTKLKKPVLVGHSMGSIVAAAVAEKYPEVLANKLVLMAPISARPPRVFTNLAPLIAVAPSDLLTLVCTLYLKSTRDFEEFGEMLAVSCMSGRQFSGRRDVLKAAKFSMSYNIGDFKFKQLTLLIAGDKDRLIKREKTEALAWELQTRGVKCQVEFLPGEGHLLNYETPTEVAERIAKFIS